MSPKKPKKPTGINGLIHFSNNSEGVSLKFQPVEYPETKEQIEKFIAEGFLKAAVRQNLISESPTNLDQNELNNFDFTLTVDEEVKFLELMEIAPLEKIKGGYKDAPDTYKPYDFSENILKKLLKKSRKYENSTKSGLVLLLYITDWRFHLDNVAIALLQYWTLNENHNFESIFLYFPSPNASGKAIRIFPTEIDFWDGFEPNEFVDNIVINLGYSDWKLGTEE